MLVLSRRLGESIMIGDGIRVSVVAISGRRVRVAIEAPREIAVDRAEVWSRKRALVTAHGAGDSRTAWTEDVSLA
jgi:carbon storage regulator